MRRAALLPCFTRVGRGRGKRERERDIVWRNGENEENLAAPNTRTRVLVHPSESRGSQLFHSGNRIRFVHPPCGGQRHRSDPLSCREIRRNTSRENSEYRGLGVGIALETSNRLFFPLLGWIEQRKPSRERERGEAQFFSTTFSIDMEW